MATYGTIGTFFIARATRSKTFKQDGVEISGLGYSSRALGSLAYRPIAAKVYDGPYVEHSRFQFENGMARLTMRQVSGTWVTERKLDTGQYALFCKKAGLSLLPQSLTAQAFVSRIAFQAKVSLEGIYIVFWYVDEDNYWMGGVFNDAGTHKAQIRRVVNGVTTVKASANTGAVSTETWYTLFVDARPGLARVYFKNSFVYDCTSATAWTSYDTTAETSGIPESYHVGLRVEEFEGSEGALFHGTVTDADPASLTDSTANFTNVVDGAWLRCNEEDRLIVGHTATQLRITPGWAEVPKPSDEYGVYTSSTKDGPQAYFRELFLCEGRIPFTVDDIIDNMLEMAGVGRSIVFTNTAVGSLSSSSPTMSDVDFKAVSSTASLTSLLWLTTTTATGVAAYSGLKLVVESTVTKLYEISGLGSATSPYQTGTATPVAVHPNLITIPLADISKEIRVQANQDFIIVSCDDHFVTAFPATDYWPSGHVATTNGVRTEFPEIMDSFIWDANQPATTVLQRLLRGRRARMIERADGTLAVSKFEQPLGNAGTYNVPIVRSVLSENIDRLYGIIEVVGAEETAIYLDSETARKTLRYNRLDNPSAQTQEEALVDAQRNLELERHQSIGGGMELYAPDPAIELEDQFTVDDVVYIAQALQTSIGNVEGRPRAQVRIVPRLAPDAVNTGAWDSAVYDSGKEYG